METVAILACILVFGSVIGRWHDAEFRGGLIASSWFVILVVGYFIGLHRYRRFDPPTMFTKRGVVSMDPFFQDGKEYLRVTCGHVLNQKMFWEVYEFPRNNLEP